MALSQEFATAFFITITEGTMVSNDILRSVRYILKINNNDLVRIFALGEVEVTAEQLAPWLRKEDEEGFVRCPDILLSRFLNGLIYEKRGRDESAPAVYYTHLTLPTILTV